MTGATAAGAAGATAAAARIRALRANGVIVKLEPMGFRELLARALAPLVVHAPAGFLGAKHRYLTSYKGLAFTTDSEEELSLPSEVERFEAKKIWIP